MRIIGVWFDLIWMSIYFGFENWVSVSKEEELGVDLSIGLMSVVVRGFIMDWGCIALCYIIACLGIDWFDFC